MAGRLHRRRQVIDAVRAAHDGLVRQAVREPDARAEVLEIGGSLTAMVGSDEVDRTGQVSRIEKRIGRHQSGNR